MLYTFLLHTILFTELISDLKLDSEPVSQTSPSTQGKDYQFIAVHMYTILAIATLLLIILLWI